MSSTRVRSTAKKAPNQQTTFEPEIRIVKKSTQQIISMLGRDPDVEKVTINKCENQITNAVVSVIFELKNLKTLCLTFNKIDDAVACEIAYNLVNSSVTKLNLDGNLIYDEGVCEIARTLEDSPLECLYLNNNRVGDAGVSEIANHLTNSCLHSLYLAGNLIKDDGARDIANNLADSNIRSLWLANNLNTCERVKRQLVDLWSERRNDPKQLFVYNYSSCM